MPIYEYACKKCGKLFEELVFSAADEAAVACPACGAGEAKRCMSACAVVSADGSGVGAPAGPAGCGAGNAAGPGGFR